ncbi:MAG: aminotransferase class V-fold PLP-dependent enzyme, partial [Betaproteobacteria bacterium]|nr:aminotransferase class V-fold PLP-dependent enzyme [Betaproteobacteria bacterium]
LSYAANGHGAWEVAIANVLAEGDLVLIPSTGHFSEGWALQTEALDRRVLRTPWREGYPIDPDEIETILRKDKEGEIKAVFVVQTDTSTGITSDVQAIREAIDRAGHPALYVVDVVSSLAATPFHMDAIVWVRPHDRSKKLFVNILGKPQTDFREDIEQEQREYLNRHEGHHACEDLIQADLGRGNAFEIKSSHRNRWRKKCGLQIECDQQAEEQGIHTKLG